MTKDNEVLDKETIEKLKNELLERKKEIEKELNAIAERDEKNPNKLKTKFPEYGDKNDENAQEITEYSTNLATEKVLESTLRDINASLERIKNNTYGICKYCHKPIGKKRMLARPVASACIACKTKLQQNA